MLGSEIHQVICTRVSWAVCLSPVSFRMGKEDAEILAKEFYPVFAPVDLVSLPNHQIYLRLMVDGIASLPFSADTVKL